MKPNLTKTTLETIFNPSPIGANSVSISWNTIFSQQIKHGNLKLLMFIYLNHHKLKLLLKSFCQLIYFLGTMFLRSFPFCTKAITPAVHLAIFDVFTNQLNMLRHFLLSITRVYRHFIGGICHWVCSIGNKILGYFTILFSTCISFYKSYKN